MYGEAKHRSIVHDFFFVSEGKAADYFWYPHFRFRQSYNDNLQLRIRRPLGAWVSAIRPGLEVGRQSEVDSLVASADWNILRYSPFNYRSKKPDLDAFEHYYSLDWQHTGERYQASIDTDYTIRTTLTAEVGESGILAPINRNQWLVAPAWTYQLTDRQRVQLNYVFQKTTYQRKKNLGVFTDYTYHTASATWFYQWNELSEISVSAFASRYEPDNLPQRADTLGAQLGLRYLFSDTLSGGISAGIRYTYSKARINKTVTINGITFLLPETRNKKDTELGWVAMADLTQKLENGRWTVSFSRQLQPLGFGGLSEQSEGRFHLERNFSQRWSTHLRLIGKLFDTTGGSARNIKRKYFSVQPSVRWRWTRDIYFELSYNYRYQKFNRNRKAADANVVSLFIRYQPLKEW